MTPTNPTYHSPTRSASQPMAGTKRTWEGNSVPRSDSGLQQPASAAALSNTGAPTPTKTTTMTSQDQGQGQGQLDEPQSQVLSVFTNFRNELDEHHDRRERVIKTSRDITALSKKIIFSLQRVRTTNTPLPPSISKEVTTRFSQIQDHFTTITPDVTGLNAYRYQHQLSSGVQEYIEALSFQHYLRTQRLISLNEVRNSLPGGVLVTEEDYLMGVFDLTGELMRFAVMALSTGGLVGQRRKEGKGEEGGQGSAGGDGDDGGGNENEYRMLGESQAGLLVDLRELRSLLEGISVPRRHSMFRDMGKKMDVMQNSVEKVERAAYGLLVRGSERPSGWMPDLSAPAVESY